MTRGSEIFALFCCRVGEERISRLGPLGLSSSFHSRRTSREEKRARKKKRRELSSLSVCVISIDSTKTSRGDIFYIYTHTHSGKKEERFLFYCFFLIDLSSAAYCTEYLLLYTEGDVSLLSPIHKKIREERPSR
jgi:hypothetical protein